MEELIKKIGAVADAEQIEAFVVGGYVRDRILGRKVTDFDVMVIGDGVRFAEHVAKAFRLQTLVVYENFGTAMLPMGEKYDHLKVEFVGARKESYRHDSRKPLVEVGDLQSDLSRRDFTINALAMRINAQDYGVILDLFNGRADLDKKTLRTPLDPDETFSDDPLRMMRAVRFASQLQFTIDPITYDGICRNAQRIAIVSQERITDEFLKILGSPKPSVGLYLLESTGLLAIIFPELTWLSGVEQQQGYLHKDVFKHTLKVVDNIGEMTNDLRLRFAALVHDIGKPRTKRFVEGIGWTFHGHEDVGSRMARGIGKKLKLPNDFWLYVSKLVKLHMRPIQLVDEGVTDSAIRRLLFDSGADFDDLLTLCRADITSGNKERAKRHLENFQRVLDRARDVEEKDRLRAFQPPIRGDEIMQMFGLPPGPTVGALKKIIEEAILEGIIPNEYQAAYDHLMAHKDEVLQSAENMQP
ncbi:MAG TPA: HD domain-containing protein [bacterium]|nr:HD domain-containing protein [bacterium]HMW37603.1 HD domain-containing protein [bacterium]HMZ05313.1 HD domain-containing protein [bacterium]HNB08337.1 HD domain-containing protein [bacterium]HNF87202.1 HD domain-containing protein [bacterium]